MAVTITDRPQTETPTPAPTPTPRRRGRRVAAWGAALAAVAATGVLVQSVVDDGGGERAPTVIERGDTKDHPLYQPTGIAPVPKITERGDTKDHPLYRPSGDAAVSKLTGRMYAV